MLGIVAFAMIYRGAYAASHSDLENALAELGVRHAHNGHQERAEQRVSDSWRRPTTVQTLLGGFFFSRRRVVGRHYDERAEAHYEFVHTTFR